MTNRKRADIINNVRVNTDLEKARTSQQRSLKTKQCKMDEFCGWSLVVGYWGSLVLGGLTSVLGLYNGNLQNTEQSVRATIENSFKEAKAFSKNVSQSIIMSNSNFSHI